MRPVRLKLRFEIMNTQWAYNPFMRFLSMPSLAILCMVAITATAAPGMADPAIWFEDARHSPDVSADTTRALAAYVRHRMLEPDKLADAPLLPASLRDDFYPRVVFISACDGIRQARVAAGSARGLLKAADDAIAQLKPDDKDSFTPRWLRLDLPATILLQENIDLNRKLEYERSLFGIAFTRASRIALLPEELIANDVVNYHQGFFIDPFYACLDARKPAIDRKKLQLDPASATLFRFSVQSCFMDRTLIDPLYRGHRMSSRVTKEDLKESIQAAAKYLTQAVSASGQFDYLYQPNLDKLADEYTMAAHFGAVLAMADAYEVLKDPDLLKAANRAVDFADSAFGQWTQGGVRVPAVVEAKRTSLGANAMTAAALARLGKAAGSASPRAQAFAQTVASAQQPDGSFIHLQRFPEGDAIDFDHAEFTGQAICALMLAHEAAGHKRWLHAADKAAQHLILVQHKGLTTAKLPHDHWLLLCLDMLHRQQPQELYLDHAARLARAIGDTQHRHPPFTDWLGGFYSPPGSTPTAMRLQGLVAAYSLLRDHGGAAHSDGAIAALDASIAASAFMLQCQFRPENAMYFKNPQRIVGAFRESLTSPYIRIDFVQHNLMGMLSLWRVMEKEKIASFAVPPATQREVAVQENTKDASPNAND